MATQKITYDNKVAINVDSTIPDINKCNASDLNQIKSVVNNNADEIPTKTSQLTNDSDFITSTDYATKQKGGVFKTETTYGTGMTNGMLRGVIAQDGQTFDGGSFLDASLVSKGSLKKWVDYKGFIDKDVNNLTNYTKTSDLSAVATSGSYTDLSNKPTIPDMSETYGTSTTDGYSEAYLNNKLVNVSTSVDSNYRTNIINSRNSFDKNTMVLKAFINATTRELANDNNFRTIYIPCKANTTYTIKKIISNRFTWGFTTDNDVNTPKVLIDVNGDSSLTEKTITSPNNSKYMFVMISKITDDTSQLQDILDSIMINEGSTPLTYEPFIQKTINVDNNKFTDTINVGTEIDSANRVNVLYSHNLLNSGMVGGTFSNGVPSTNNPNKRLRNDDYIQVNYNENYTISASYNGSLQVNIMQYDASKNFIIETGWNNVPKTQLIPSNCKYIMFVFKDVNDADISTSTITKVQVKKGSEVGSYEPPLTPSINVDGEEIYSKPVVLWENSSPTSEFASQQITLNDTISNYKYYEILSLLNKTSEIMISTGKTSVNYGAYLSSNANFISRRTTQVPSGTNLTINDSIFNGTYGAPGTTNNDSLIPYQILGYK